MLIQRRTFLGALASIPVVGIVARQPIALESTYEIGFQGYEWKFVIETFTSGFIGATFAGKSMAVISAGPDGWCQFLLEDGGTMAAIRLKRVDHQNIEIDWINVKEPRI